MVVSIYVSLILGKIQERVSAFSLSAASDGSRSTSSGSNLSTASDGSHSTSSGSNLVGRDFGGTEKYAAQRLGASTTSSLSVAELGSTINICGDTKENYSDDEFINSLNNNVFEAKDPDDGTSPEMTSFFRRWGFAKYGAKKGCPRCKDLVSRGSSRQKHSFTCPSLTGEQISSSSDESVVPDAEVVESHTHLGKDDDYFPMESTFDLSSSFFDADFGEVASESVTDANTTSYNSKESSKLVSNSRSSNYKDTLDATTTSYNSKESTKLVSNSRSSNYKDTLDATTTSYNSKESSQHFSYEQDESSKSVYRDVLELLTDTNLAELVNKMYDSANSNGYIGSLGVPRPYPESFYEPFEKKKDSFIIGGFIDESTGKYLRKWLTVEQSLKVRFCFRNLNLCLSKNF